MFSCYVTKWYPVRRCFSSLYLMKMLPRNSCDNREHIFTLIRTYSCCWSTQYDSQSSIHWYVNQCGVVMALCNDFWRGTVVYVKYNMVIAWLVDLGLRLVRKFTHVHSNWKRFARRIINDYNVADVPNAVATIIPELIRSLTVIWLIWSLWYRRTNL